MSAFVDTSGLYALVEPSEALLTHNYVLAEKVALVALATVPAASGRQADTRPDQLMR